MNLTIKTSIGAGVAGLFVGRCVPHWHHAAWAHALLIFAALVLLPLAWPMFADGEDATGAGGRILPGVERGLFPAGLLLAVSCFLAPGWVAAVAALPWAALLMVLAYVGWERARRGGWARDLDQLVRDVAMGYGAVAAGWVMLDRAGVRPWGFEPSIVTLTAVHFHFAGMLLLLGAAEVQRELFFLRLASRAAVGTVLGVPAVAGGITVTQLGWGSGVEAGASCGLALAGMAVGVLQVRIAIEAKRPLVTRLLLGTSGASLFCAMLLAVAYALRSSVPIGPGLALPEMRILHGSLNAFGFGWCGVLGWRQLRAQRPTH